MRTHGEGTPHEKTPRQVRNRKKGTNKVDSLSEEALINLEDKMEKIVDPESGEMKLKCKLCLRRSFRLVDKMEKHLKEHKAGRNFVRYTYKRKTGEFMCEICGKQYRRFVVTIYLCDF